MAQIGVREPIWGSLGVLEVVQVVQSSASTNDIGHGIAFWSWSYVTAAVKLDPARYY